MRQASTLEALVIVLVFVLPGAFYEWSYERVVGSWNVQLSDRILRFLGSSAVLHTLAFGGTFWVWRRYFSAGRFEDIQGLPWGLWLALALAVGAPTALGAAVGRATRAGRRWVVPIVGSSPAPRAWDHLFFRGGPGWVRLKLRSGGFVAGQYATASSDAGGQAYAAGFPIQQTCTW